eukprot:UN02372
MSVFVAFTLGSTTFDSVEKPYYFINSSFNLYNIGIDFWNVLQHMDIFRGGNYFDIDGYFYNICYRSR